MKHIASLVVLGLLLFVTLSTAAGADNPSAADKEWAQLQGTWRVTRAIQNGVDVKANLGWELYTVKGNATSVVKNGNTYTSTLQIDPARNPKWITVTFPSGKHLEGIYELKNSGWRILMRDSGRPEGWNAQGGVLWEYERTTPATQPSAK